MPAGARILYVDDDDGLRLLIRRALERRGFAVTLAADGHAGVALAAAEAFDVIAVDHYMPGMDGLATLAALRALPDPPPVVYVTGTDEGRIAVAALKAGADDYVVKAIGDEFFDLLATTLLNAVTQVRLRRAKDAAESALRASNARLEALLREVNHRVANSLQLVVAFVQMQANALPEGEARAALSDTQRRIEAIGAVHRRLYTSDDVESVDMDEYLAAIVQELEDSWSRPGAPRRLRLTADAIRLHPDKAVSVGVIVNELVSNACKYAYPAAELGEIRVALSDEGGRRFRLRVEDDGCGLPEGDQAKGTGIGAKLVRAMAASLGSRIDYESDGRGLRASLVAAY